ncbi:MBL fold metallo-hydrolase [Sporosarcina limicola]|uniref:Cft2 family RNA processing exonuclease n=1 Tax=Sporosarcina limicola TaxID=34101 RepID=A0A927MHB4_9BACL|nr:MBL fold metallo-hydrolase [Sporosarcina limicola]MBE1554618.1 Cft2 family RNA processing exonuclease [Sporosarcina limicola]
MKVSILGGGSEVGASCLHIEIGGTNLLIDAGMRMHGEDLLPALGMLDELSSPDCILVTHAHADHIGALPIVHSLFPAVPIYTMPPTVDLMNVMMKDAYKILEQRSKLMNSLPFYTKEQVDELLQSLLLFPANGVLKVGDVTITSYRAGHILGAVMFLIEGDGESLLVTGDLSFKAGRTIPGAEVPHGVHPDVVIMESTYGNRAHTDRNTEERRLAEHVSEVIAGGGFALIPAFALGRAQEVLLVLQDYMEKGLIPEFPIYVDGLVTPISRIYKNYPHFLKGPVAHRIRRNGDAFLTEGRCKAVNPQEREMILKGKPGCIVASSGMLTGGASSWYAEQLISGEKNAIFITGYQDEESPGRKLLDLADGLKQTLDLNGTSYEVKCRIGKYGLSAHADANEMNRFIQSLKPTYTLLVHGDDEARSRLGELIDPRFGPVLVENGETYPFEKRTSGNGIIGKRYKVNNPVLRLQEKIGSLLLYRSEDQDVLKLALCTGVHPKTSALICQTLKGKPVRLTLDQVVETVGRWNGPINELEEAARQVFSFSRPILEKISWLELSEGEVSLDVIIDTLCLTEMKDKLAVAVALQSLPEEHRRKQSDESVCYLVDEKVKISLKELTLPIQSLKVNSAAAMETTRNILENHPRFMRCGTNDLGTEKERLLLYFDFPNVISESERGELIEQLKNKTGWDIDFSDSIRQDLLNNRLMELFGSAIGTPSIHLHDRKIVISTERLEDAEKLITQFEEITGFRLQFKEEPNAAVVFGDNTSTQVESSGNRLENNQAIEETKRWAKDRGITLYKVGIKQEMIEVHFISPEIAVGHETDLEELSWRIGRPVSYATQPKQNEIIRITMANLPSAWESKKMPSIHMDRAIVALKLTNLPEEHEQNNVREKIKKETGYTLEVTT